METEQKEAQICRLCGKCESIYIDVFGEEGRKRLLGIKIYTKINIVIDERDPLPKAICVQCLGKLEFVCDFQEECLRTQQLLCDRYNLPSLSDIVVVKNEETSASTSANNNNNIDKNLNSSNEEIIEEVELSVLRTVVPSDDLENETETVIRTEEPLQEKDVIPVSTEQSIEETQIVPTSSENENDNENENERCENVDASTPNSEETAPDEPATNRLQSQENSSAEISVASHDNSDENIENHGNKDSHTIQLPTSALNKLLTIVSNSSNIEVSVKESRNHVSDIEDISFTVELCKKQSDDVSTVRAKVFPDQGSCVVDKAIVGLLQNQNCMEVNTIINTIIDSSVKNGATTKLKDITEFEQKWQANQNPEQLFKIDGEEIRVDDNVEHIVADNQNGYACKLCRKFYERKDKCMVHVKTHLGIKQYTCILCNAKFVCKSDVMKHIRCSHTNPRPIQCPKCPKRFKSKFYLTEHDNVHKGVRPYCCTDCGQSYHHKVSLQIHMKSHLPPQNLACEYCGKVFPYRTRLLSHIASVHLKNRRNFRCRFCYNLYSSLSVLNEHIKTQHATTYTCEVCSKTFKVASKYKAHVLQHSNPKPFACNICNNRYASKAFLNEHLLKHEGLRKHVCQKCGASFAQASHLAAHRHVHGEKKHACPECGRKFNRRDNMKVHRKRHFEEKKTAPEQNNTTGSDASSAAANEKIKENDGLPQRICVRCVGTLEFWCDFYDYCHQTQRELLDTTTQIETRHGDQLDPEADKENSAPLVNDSSRRKKNLKFLSPNSTNVAKSISAPSNATLETENAEAAIAELSDRRSSPLKEIVQNQSSLLHNIFYKTEACSEVNVQQILERNANLKKDVKHEEKEQQVVKRPVGRPKKSAVLNNFINRPSTEDSLHRRKRYRKSNAELLSEAAQSLNYTTARKDALRNVREETATNNRKHKRHCLRTIYANKRSDTDSVPPRRKEEKVETCVNEPKQLRTTTVTSPCISRERNVSADNEIADKKDGGTKSLTPEQLDSPLQTEREQASGKSKPVSVIVKQEKAEEDDALVHNKLILKPNPFVWIPNEILTIQAHKPKIPNEKEVSNTSPPPGDEAEKNKLGDIDTIVSQNDVANRSESLSVPDTITTVPLSEQNRVTVIKLLQSNEIIVPELMENKRERVETTSDSLDRKAKDCLENDSVDESCTRSESSRDSSFSGSKSFGKVSDLISDEQKETIETFYKVDMSVVNPEEVQKHLTIVDRKSIRCNICGVVYLRMDKCQVHIWGHLQMKPYQCKACNFTTLTVSNVRCHIRKSHLKIKPFACHLCEKRYVTAVLLEEHINTHTGARPFKCKVCGFASASRQMLSYHNATHKPTKDVDCKICGKQFYSRSRLRAHMLIHNKDKVVMCKLCSAYLSNAEALEMHHKNIHMRDYICNVCGKRVKSRKALHNHQNVHAVAKYKCTLCPNVYKSSQILKEHLLKHEGIRKYKCNICGKSFAQQSHLAAHMAVHSAIRFHCPGCDKAFNRHDNMKIHTKRCKSFLANPDLHKLLIKREKSRSLNGKTEPLDAKPSVDPSPDSYEECQSTSTENAHADTEKTDTSLCQLGLNISCIEPVGDKAWNCDILQNKREVDIISLPNPDDKAVDNTEDTIILEKILAPENF